MIHCRAEAPIQSANKDNLAALHEQFLNCPRKITCPDLQRGGGGKMDGESGSYTVKSFLTETPG